MIVRDTSSIIPFIINEVPDFPEMLDVTVCFLNKAKSMWSQQCENLKIMHVYKNW